MDDVPIGEAVGSAISIREAEASDLNFVVDLIDEALGPYYGGDHRAHAERIFQTHISGGVDNIGHFSIEQKMFLAVVDGAPAGRIRGEPPRNSLSGSSVGSGIRRKGARMSTRARDVDSVALPPTGIWELDPAHTSVEVVARHILTKVRGRFASFSGTIQIAEKLEGSNTEVEIDAASIQTGVEMRDNHLKSDDFFAVERFPKIRFKSTELRPVGGTAFQLVGHLTVRDITRPVTLDVEFLGWWDDPMTGKRASFTASTEVEREDWDVSWNQVLETGGLLVGKRVRLEIEVEAVRTRDAE